MVELAPGSAIGMVDLRVRILVSGDAYNIEAGCLVARVSAATASCCPRVASSGADASGAFEGTVSCFSSATLRPTSMRVTRPSPSNTGRQPPPPERLSDRRCRHAPPEPGLRRTAPGAGSRGSDGIPAVAARLGPGPWWISARPIDLYGPEPLGRVDVLLCGIGALRQRRAGLSSGGA